MPLPAFGPATRLRPISIVQPGPLGPFPAIEATPATSAQAPTLTLAAGGAHLHAHFGTRVTLTVEDGAPTRHRPRRPVRAPGPPERVALTLTGDHLCALTRHEGTWVIRARVDLRGRLPTRDEAWLASAATTGDGVTEVVTGGFGQLGLRDPRVVTHADGTPYRHDGRLLLTLTSAGPGFFDTAHTSLWSLDPATLALKQRAELFFRRPVADQASGVYGDHATQLIHERDHWLVVTTTWGDFRAKTPGARVAATLARTEADLLTGRHILDTEPLRLPTPPGSVGVWDPHLARTPHGWITGYVAARRFFDFYPVVAQGPTLDTLTLRAARPERRATEGTTLLRLADTEKTGEPNGLWRVLASDGRDNRRPHQAEYPVFDLDLRQLGVLEADYPTNIPWPALARIDDGSWLLIGFDGTPHGGRLADYGTHGDLVIARSV